MNNKLVKIVVTQEHINRSRAFFERYEGSISSHCPIALACREILKENVTVGQEKLHIDGSKVCELPMEARKFIRQFDKGPYSEVEPFEFEIILDQ